MESTLRGDGNSLRNTIGEACKVFSIIAGQTGILAIIGGKVAGLDMLSSAKAYSRLHDKLVKSYAMEAIAGKTAKGKRRDSAIQKKATEFLTGLPQCEEKKFKSVGLGDDYRYKAAHVVGSALVHQDCVPHASFFLIESDKKDVRMTNLSRRRQYRVY